MSELEADHMQSAADTIDLMTRKLNECIADLRSESEIADAWERRYHEVKLENEKLRNAIQESKYGVRTEAFFDVLKELASLREDIDRILKRSAKT